jgi:hypothetical protein
MSTQGSRDTTTKRTMLICSDVKLKASIVLIDSKGQIKFKLPFSYGIIVDIFVEYQLGYLLR